MWEQANSWRDPAGRAGPQSTFDRAAGRIDDELRDRVGLDPTQLQTLAAVQELETITRRPPNRVPGQRRRHPGSTAPTEDVCTRIRDAIDRVAEECVSDEDRGRARLDELAGIVSRGVALAASWTADLARSGSAGRPARGGILRSGDEARPQVRLLALMASTAGPNGTDVGAPGGGEDGHKVTVVG